MNTPNNSLSIKDQFDAVIAAVDIIRAARVNAAGGSMAIWNQIDRILKTQDDRATELLQAIRNEAC